MSNIIPFVYQGFGIRTIAEGDGVWYVAKDIADVLGHSNSSSMVDYLDEDEKGYKKVSTLGGDQEMLVVNEHGIYTLLFRSNKAEAKPFRRWVTHEVLPTIRRTGSYSLNRTPAEMLLVQCQMLVEQERATKALAAGVDRLNVKIEEIDCKGELALQRGDDAMVRAEQAVRRVECNYGMFSVLGYCAKSGHKLSWKEASKHGKALTKLCKGLGAKTDTVSDPRFGTVKTYPEQILRDYFTDKM